MFSNTHTAEFIAHLQAEISRLRAANKHLLEMLEAKDTAAARERQELLNRLAGLPPQPPAAGTDTAANTEPTPYRSRIRDMIEQQGEEMRKAYLATQAEQDKGLAQFREEVKAELAAREGAE